MSWRDEVVAAVTGVLDDEPAVDDTFGPVAVDVPVVHWTEAVCALRDRCGATYLDWLSAVDELADGFRVVVHVARLGTPVRSVVVRTRVPRDTPELASLVPVFAGAAWHERETHEMFGIDFTDGVALDALLLPEGFEGHPLRKDFVLASRVAKPWPGAKEPGESDGTAGGSPSRRKTLPPGVPDPAAWGPREPGSPAPDPLAAASTAGPAARPRRARKAAPPGVTPEPGVQPPDGSAAPADVASQPPPPDDTAPRPPDG